MKVVLASRNQGKIKEFNAYLHELGWQVIGVEQFADVPEVVEDGKTFADNAIKKAREVMLATKMPAFADDSGIVVEALGGRPGVYSARYAGEGATDQENNRKLLGEMQDVPDDQRQAKFVCYIAFITPKNPEQPELYIGECHGYLLREPRGEGGFGYDPLFYLPEEGKTMAEVTMERKNQISHRANALKKMCESRKSNGLFFD